MRLADSHCHVDFPAFGKDRQAVLQRARQEGVELLVLAGCARERARRTGALQLCLEHPGYLYLVCGVHPHETEGIDEADHDHVAELARQGQLVGIGETGLDFFHDFSERDAQRAAFRRFLRLARRVELPVVIHTRDAEPDTLRILAEEGLPARGGVIHCFSGSAKLAQAALEMGLYLGVSGMITYAWAEELRQTLRRVPLERLLLETDAPYLAPLPFRGKRNEPALVRAIAERLASERGLPVEEVARITTESCRKLYRLAAPAPGQSG
ncbi:MAG: TatD family deoxyribonuclease [Deltaproteobacteria bacterium]|nr:TatD family deoxyribonuclease [Deltaproteobacteria bacterium]